MQPLYRVASRLLPERPAPLECRRILLIRPCCIGDVVLATAALRALRAAYPAATITWAVGGWSRAVVDGHPDVDAVLDTGLSANPAQGPRALWRFVRAVRRGHHDLLVSLVRSPWMSLAAALSGVPHRVGLDSGGRGFGYTVRVPVDPAVPQHEATIYLNAAAALGAATDGLTPSVPIHPAHRAEMRAKREAAGLTAGTAGRYLVINPAGGSNPGMTLDAKRWPPSRFADLGQRLAARYDAQIVLLGGPADGPILDAVTAAGLRADAVFLGALSFGQIAALAAEALAYIGNDTGLTHLAAAAGAVTAMILGPSDPARYGPVGARSIALWRPVDLAAGGVAAAKQTAWDWARDGIDVAAAEAGIVALIDQAAGAD